MFSPLTVPPRDPHHLSLITRIRAARGARADLRELASQLAHYTSPSDKAELAIVLSRANAVQLEFLERALLLNATTRS